MSEETVLEEKELRNQFVRALVSWLWLIIIVVCIDIAIGAVVGFYAGLGTTSSAEGARAGSEASTAFFMKYGFLTNLVNTFIAMFLIIYEKLPGTSKLKKKND